MSRSFAVWVYSGVSTCLQNTSIAFSLPYYEYYLKRKIENVDNFFQKIISNNLVSIAV